MSLETLRCHLRLGRIPPKHYGLLRHDCTAGLLVLLCISGWVNPLVFVVCAALAFAWSRRQVGVSDTAICHLADAYQERGMALPSVPEYYWQAENMLEALEAYDARQCEANLR